MASVLIIEDNLELANLLSSISEMRGHSTRVALSGAESMVAMGQARFDAAVVDLFLPDMNGTEVLARLRDAGIATWAMSGVFKGDTFATQAVEEFGAVAFFEKPFPILELLTQIEQRFGPHTEVTEALTDDVEIELVETVAVNEPVPDVSTRLSPLSVWEQAWKEPAATAVRKPLERSGSLSQMSVPRLLNAAYQSRLSGELVVRREPALKVVSLEEGHAVYAASNLAHERFARFCARKGLLPQSDLEAVAALAKEQGLKTGEAMVQLGLLNANQRKKLLAEQIKEIIWSTFSWVDGDFAFAPDKPLRPDVVKISVYPGDLILEGALREPLVSLRDRLASTVRLFPVADPPYQLETLTLTDDQASVVAHTDGTKTVDDLLALTDLAEREVLGLLVGLKQMGLLEERKEAPSSRRQVSYGL